MKDNKRDSKLWKILPDELTKTQQQKLLKICSKGEISEILPAQLRYALSLGPAYFPFSVVTGGRKTYNIIQLIAELCILMEQEDRKIRMIFLADQNKNIDMDAFKNAFIRLGREDLFEKYILHIPSIRARFKTKLIGEPGMDRNTKKEIEDNIGKINRLIDRFFSKYKAPRRISGFMDDISKMHRLASGRQTKDSKKDLESLNERLFETDPEEKVSPEYRFRRELFDGLKEMYLEEFLKDSGKSYSSQQEKEKIKNSKAYTDWLLNTEEAETLSLLYPSIYTHTDRFPVVVMTHSMAALNQIRLGGAIAWTDTLAFKDAYVFIDEVDQFKVVLRDHYLKTGSVNQDLQKNAHLVLENNTYKCQMPEYKGLTGAEWRRPLTFRNGLPGDPNLGFDYKTIFIPDLPGDNFYSSSGDIEIFNLVKKEIVNGKEKYRNYYIQNETVNSPDKIILTPDKENAYLFEGKPVSARVLPKLLSDIADYFVRHLNRNIVKRIREQNDGRFDYAKALNELRALLQDNYFDIEYIESCLDRLSFTREFRAVDRRFLYNFGLQVISMENESPESRRTTLNSMIVPAMPEGLIAKLVGNGCRVIGASATVDIDTPLSNLSRQALEEFDIYREPPKEIKEGARRVAESLRTGGDDIKEFWVQEKISEIIQGYNELKQVQNGQVSDKAIWNKVKSQIYEYLSDPKKAGINSLETKVNKYITVKNKDSSKENLDYQEREILDLLCQIYYFALNPECIYGIAFRNQKPLPINKEFGQMLNAMKKPEGCTEELIDIVVPVDSENFEQAISETKQKVKEGKGLCRRLLITSYATMSRGVNLQIDFSEHEFQAFSQALAQINPLVNLHEGYGRSKSFDVNFVSFQIPTHQVAQIRVTGNKEKDDEQRLQMVLESDELRYSGDVSMADYEWNMKRIFLTKRYKQDSFLSNFGHKARDLVAVQNAKAIRLDQSCGRCDRGTYKTKNIFIGISPYYFNQSGEYPKILEAIPLSFTGDRLLRFFIEQCTGPTKELDQLTQIQRRMDNLYPSTKRVVDIVVDRIGKGEMSEEFVDRYQLIREYSLKNPRGLKESEIRRSCFVYSGDISSVRANSIYEDGTKITPVISEEASFLPDLIKYDGVATWFKENDYATYWEGEYLMEPQTFYIYKGAVGEEAVRGTLKEVFDIKTLPLEGDIFEIADFYFIHEDGSVVFVDVKNYGTNSEDIYTSQEWLRKTRWKLERLKELAPDEFEGKDFKFLYITTFSSDEGAIAKEWDNGAILTIPGFFPNLERLRLGQMKTDKGQYAHEILKGENK